jgi:(S)-2-hydroxyglutarate dehydrogenase
MAARYLRTGLAEMYRSFSKRAFVADLQQLVPAVSAGDLERGGAGVRAQAVDRDGSLVDDFRINQRDGIVTVRNAPSPAATSSLAIAEYVLDHAGLVGR